jgi:uncharacterized membrane protein YjgN (DUF898 family)
MVALDTLETQVKGSRADLFALVLKTGLLMVLTLGLYSFWARTRLRRWMWSSVRPGGMPLEYTGEPLEKLIGFFVAAVLLVFYIGLGMMVILFFSLNITGDPLPGLGFAVLLVTPLYFVAQYRGRRYLVNHTSWRGLSFSMAPGAFGYMWRAILYYTLAFASVGLLWPVATFRLRKYMMDRTYFGDDRFFQAGRSTMLYKAYAPLMVLAMATILLPVYAAVSGDGGIGFLALLTGPAAIIAWAYYKVASFRLMAAELIFSGGMEFDIYPRTGQVMKIHILGNVLIFLILSVVVPILGVMIFAIIGALGAGAGLEDVVADDFSLGALFGLPEWVLIVVPLLIYLTIFVMRGQLKHVFITFPKLRHAAETLVIHDAAVLSATRAGKDQHMADADGLSSFFDFGGSI